MLAPEGVSFSQDWFSNHIPAWTTIISRLRPKRILEIGCYEGRSTSFVIESCTAFGPIHLTCVDTWDGSADLPPDMMTGVEDRFDRNVALAIARAAGTVTMQKLKQPSSVALTGMIAAQARPFDLIYVDGSHTAPDVLVDAILAFQLLRKGGVLIFDDYLWSAEAPPAADPLNTPKLAIDVFATIFARKLRVLPDFPSAQCYMEKIAA